MSAMEGGDKAFVLILAICFGTCATCTGLQSWRTVEQERNEIRRMQVECEQAKKPRGKP